MKPIPPLEGELTDDEAPFVVPLARVLVIDSPEARLLAWECTATFGVNCLRSAGVLYGWDRHPRRLQNGAVQGRCYAQARGELNKDIGGYKIGADGTVLRLPAELRDLLPGGSGAQVSTSSSEE